MKNKEYKGMSKTANFFFLIAVFVIIAIAALQSKWLRSSIKQTLIKIQPRTSQRFTARNISKSFYSFAPIRKMVYVPAGEFLMGGTSNSNEKPIHKVMLNGFWIDKFEVTNEDFEKFNPEHKKYRKISSNKNKQPAIHITWFDAQQYCNWRCDNENLPRGTYRLPTEAEWEYAARGGLVQKKYPWGNFSPNTFNFFLAKYKPNNKNSNYCENVGSFQPNGFGIYDMAGNVREWCFDWLDNYPSDSTNYVTFNPKGPAKAVKKVWRGGSWGSLQNDLRCAARGGISPHHWLDNLGFRCVRIK
ncbi:MAG: hypothetical protein DRI44_07730 [Chlamydiae bacterium]|nr:MAG: hypothetical protein DRI44_07730 [Chlamydiota bacterium]